MYKLKIFGVVILILLLTPVFLAIVFSYFDLLYISIKALKLLMYDVVTGNFHLTMY